MILHAANMANYSTPTETLDNKQEGTSHNDSRMAWFTAFRGEFGYSNFGEYRTSVTFDIQFVIIIYTCVLISVATLIVAAGIRGKERWYTLLRVLYSLAVGSIILVSLYGYCWQIGHIKIHSPYIYRTEGQIDATLGVRIGLRTVNLTLSGEYMDSRNIFNYNEEYELIKVLKSPVQMVDGVSRGLPSPLLFLIEHFDMDDGDIRFGRCCFMAGYFADLFLWSAFISWVAGTILMCSVIWYGAVLYMLTGVCMLLAVILYHTFCKDAGIHMPYTDRVLQFSYGWCFWSVLVFGILNTLIGVIVLTLEYRAPKLVAEFFQLETRFEDTEEFKLFMGPSSRAPTVPSTPVPDIRVDSDSKLKAPNWFMNYGYDGPKNNPVFVETGNDPTKSGTDVNNPSESSRKIDRIKEERSGSSNKPDGDTKINMNSPNNSDQSNESTFNRLNEIYVDVEPTHRKEGTINDMYIEGLESTINGK